jgi:hypothetical protein
MLNSSFAGEVTRITGTLLTRPAIITMFDGVYLVGEDAVNPSMVASSFLPLAEHQTLNVAGLIARDGTCMFFAFRLISIK